MAYWNVDACGWVDDEEPRGERPQAWWEEPVEPPGDVAAIRQRIRRLREAWPSEDRPPGLDCGRANPHQDAMATLWAALDQLDGETPDIPTLAEIPNVTDYLLGNRNRAAFFEYRTALDVAAAFVATIAATTPTDARNRFCWESWDRGRTYKEIWVELKRHPEWEQVTSHLAVRGPINSWAKLKNLPVRSGHPGAPKRKPAP